MASYNIYEAAIILQKSSVNDQTKFVSVINVQVITKLGSQAKYDLIRSYPGKSMPFLNLIPQEGQHE